MNTFWKGVLWVVGIVVVVGGAYVLLNKQGAPIADGAPFVIGGMMPLTGDLGALGEEVHKGALMAIEEAQVEFPDIRFIAEDDRFNGRDMVAAAQKLVSKDGVDAAFTVAVQEAKPVAPIFNEAKIPLLVSWDSNEFIRTGGESLYSIGFSTEGAGETMAEYAYGTLGIRKAAVIYHVDEWAEVITGAFRAKFKELGGTVVLDQSAIVGTNDYRTLIARAKAAGADAIYFPMVPPGNSIFTSQARELKFAGALLNGDGFLQSEIDAAGSAAEGLYFTNMHGMQLSVLAEKYKNKYGADSGDIAFASFGYDAVKTLVAAYRISKESGSTIAEALKRVDIDGIGGRIAMNGTRSSEKYERVYKVVKGVPVLAQ